MKRAPTRISLRIARATCLCLDIEHIHSFQILLRRGSLDNDGAVKEVIFIALQATGHCSSGPVPVDVVLLNGAVWLTSQPVQEHDVRIVGGCQGYLIELIRNEGNWQRHQSRECLAADVNVKVYSLPKESLVDVEGNPQVHWLCQVVREDTTVDVIVKSDISSISVQPWGVTDGRVDPGSSLAVPIVIDVFCHVSSGHDCSRAWCMGLVDVVLVVEPGSRRVKRCTIVAVAVRGALGVSR